MTPRVSRRVEGLVLTVLAPLLAAAFVYLGWLWRFDYALYDWSQRLVAPPAADDIVIVAIDDRSLNQIGPWPWSREVHAGLIDRLTEHGAAVVALHLILTEPSAEAASDAHLAQALRRNGRTLLPVGPGQPTRGSQLVEMLPVSGLAGAAAGLGHVDIAADGDGIIRGLYLRAGLGSPYWSSLPLAILEQLDPAAVLDLPGERAPPGGAPSPYAWQRDHRVLIPFAGPPGSYRRVSYVDALRADLPADLFRDRVVLVGATASDLGAELATPVASTGALMSGVEFNANAFDALREGRAIVEVGTGATMLAAALAVLAPLLVYPLLTTRWTLAVAGSAVALALAGSAFAMHQLGLWFRPAAAVTMIAASYPVWSWIQLRHALRYQRSLAEAQERALVTLHSVGDGVITTDARGEVVDLNPTAQRLTGYGLEETRGRPLEAILRVIDEHSREPEPLPQPERLQRGTVTRQAQPSLLVDRLGQEAVIRTSAAPIHDRDGRPLGMVLAIADITEARRLAERTTYQATHDLLTGLPNRMLLEDRLLHALARARRTAQPLALLFIDLDRFKNVNDGLGLNGGDALLQAVATELGAGLRDTDTMARLGSDEFVVVLESIGDAASAVLVAEKLLARLETPLAVGQHELRVTCSIGVALFPQDGGDVATLLRNADSAMYRAKQLGRAKVQLYARGMNGGALDELLLAQRLRHAIDNDELELWYQPQIDLHSGRPTGVEALVRWQHPERGLLQPDAFVPLAEASSLIGPLDTWVFGEACRQARLWRQCGLADLRVGVNLSPEQFAVPDIGRMIARTVAAAELEPGRFELEITERTIMQDVERTVANLRELKTIGIALAIDDFGIGYSSLSHLTALPVDRLKIDRSFVRTIPANAENSAIAGAIIALAQSLGLGVVAEGVETWAQIEFLRAKGCHEVQGHLICRAIPAGSLTSLLHASATLLPRA